MSEIAISITSLHKNYANGFHALKGVSFNVNKGDFFALLGPNGAGKSTTIGILCGLVTKTSGSASINGYCITDHIAEAKAQLGIVPQEFNFNIFEPCHQIMINQAGYYGVSRSVAISRTKVLFDQLGLTDKANVAAGTLSGGLKRRLMIARSLVHHPKILILDEPTAGVDISLRRSMWHFLKEKNQEGLTIILTTHYLEEAEQLCKNIAIINHGELITNTTMKQLLNQLNSEIFILDCSQLPVQLPHIENISMSAKESSTLEIEVPKTHTISQIIHQLQAHDIIVNRIQTKANRLEELFIRLVGAPS